MTSASCLHPRTQYLHVLVTVSVLLREEHLQSYTSHVMRCHNKISCHDDVIYNILVCVHNPPLPPHTNISGWLKMLNSRPLESTQTFKMTKIIQRTMDLTMITLLSCNPPGVRQSRMVLASNWLTTCTVLKLRLLLS